MTHIFSRRQSFWLILGLMLLAAWLRWWQLNTIPPGLWFDEAYNGMDAIGILDQKSWPVFLTGNNGREALYHYFLALSIFWLGQTALALRFVSTVIGLLTVPLMYRWGLVIFSNQRNRHHLALAASAGVAVSFWALIMNRTAYRANLLPFFVLAVSYFFWRGGQSAKYRYFVGAGILLGISQYTYLAARLLPLVFGLFVLAQTVLWWRDRQPGLKLWWGGLVVMSLAAAMVAAPLLLFFSQNPEAFWGRTGDVAFKVNGSPEGVTALAGQLWAAIRVFWGGQDPNWRHHLLGRPVFDWFTTACFWMGMTVALRRYRRPVYLFLLIALGVMWLPAPLSEPAFHTLRLAGILPAYYAIVAIGLVAAIEFLASRAKFVSGAPSGPVALAALLLVSGGQTVVDYFGRWGQNPAVYRAFDGPVVRLAEYALSPEAGQDIVIPYYLYTHASFRYLINDSFKEEVFMPKAVSAKLADLPELPLLTPVYPPDDNLPPAYVWLHKDSPHGGTAYVSAVNRDHPVNRLALAPGVPVKGDGDDMIAHRYAVDPSTLLPLFAARLPQKQASIRWGDNLRLTGYQFITGHGAPGQPAYLYLAWDLLGYTGLTQKMFLQMINSQGEPVYQQELEPVSRKMYRWREADLVLEQHPLPALTQFESAPYFVRLGFFDPVTGRRLPAQTDDGQPVAGDEWIVGPYYGPDGNNVSFAPEHPLAARFGNEFLLAGYTLEPHDTATAVHLYWQSLAATPTDFTVFVQAINAQNQVVAQIDAQPLPAVYPTSRWQPGDQFISQFLLPAQVKNLPAGSRLVTGMYNLTTGVRLPVYDEAQNRQPNDMLQLVP